jgi:putative phosphoserine phosphatase/1-acylglycerol-3-phosphate O-acyltransferase
VDFAEQLARIETAPQGASVGAFFDLDGTLVSGYTASTFFTDRVKSREVDLGTSCAPSSRSSTARTSAGSRREGPSRVCRDARQSEETMTELGERLFVQKIAGTIRPEARELVRAHQRRGHTVVIASAASKYQIQPVATDLLASTTSSAPSWPSRTASSPASWTGACCGAPRRPVGCGLSPDPMTSISRQASPTATAPRMSRSLGLSGRRSRSTRTRGCAERPRPSAGRSSCCATRVVSARPTWCARSPPSVASTPVPPPGWPGAWSAAIASEGINFGIGLACQSALRLAGVHLRVVGEEKIPDGPAVYVANHQSSVDPLVAATLIHGEFTVVAKKEARFDPRSLVGSLLLEPAYIDRSNSEQSRATLDALVSRIRGGTSLLIFPRGHSLDDAGARPVPQGRLPSGDPSGGACRADRPAQHRRDPAAARPGASAWQRRYRGSRSDRRLDCRRTSTPR